MKDEKKIEERFKQLTEIFGCKKTIEDCNHKSCHRYFRCESLTELILAREKELKGKIEEEIKQRVLSGRFTYCAYCGKEFEIEKDGTTEQVGKHINECPNHPIAEYKNKINELQSKIERAKEIITKLIPSLHHPFSHDYVGEEKKCDLCKLRERAEEFVKELS